jgi:hypothetical protein
MELEQAKEWEQLQADAMSRLRKGIYRKDLGAQNLQIARILST